MPGAFSSQREISEHMCACDHAKGAGSAAVGNTGKSQEILEEKTAAGKEAKLSIWKSAHKPTQLTYSITINSVLTYDMTVTVLNTEDPRLNKT